MKKVADPSDVIEDTSLFTGEDFDLKGVMDADAKEAFDRKADILIKGGVMWKRETAAKDWPLMMELQYAHFIPKEPLEVYAS